MCLNYRWHFLNHWVDIKKLYINLLENKMKIVHLKSFEEWEETAYKTLEAIETVTLLDNKQIW